jgi:MSHA biogenesis protein MshO
MIRCQRGFSLIEMIVAVTLSAIVVGFMSLFLVAPVDAYFAQERRTELADSANNAIRMLDSDIRHAVPESVRFASVSGNLAMELLYAVDVARYRSGAAPQDLSIGSPDLSFSTIGRLTRMAPGIYPGNVYLVVGHPSGGDAYSPSNVITPPGTSITIAPEVAGTGEQVITFDSLVTFAVDSPTRSVYFVREPVSYVCNPGAGTLTRFWGYPISADQSTHATEADLALAGASSALVARDLTTCTFQATAATAYYGGLIRIRLRFSREGEVVEVFDQAQVENRP